MTERQELEWLIARGADLVVASTFPGMPAALQITSFKSHRDFALDALRFLLVAVGPQNPCYRQLRMAVEQRFAVDIESSIGILREARQYLRAEPDGETATIAFEDLLHPIIRDHAYRQFLDGHFREAVFNSVVAVFDYLRERTGLRTDGSALAADALNPRAPRLLIADINSDSGRNEQIGFMHIMQGAYSAVRNPKAHTLHHDTPREVAAQYLVFASLLARRLNEARQVRGADEQLTG